MVFAGKNGSWAWTREEATEIKKIDKKLEGRRQLTLNQPTLSSILEQKKED